MATNRIGTGGKGKSFNDRELAGKVRTLALNQVFDVLSGKGLGKDKEYKKAVLIKLTGTILPRLNELSGEDGATLLVEISERIAEKRKINDSSQNTK